MTDDISKAAALMGSKGGKAGTGKSKVHGTPEQRRERARKGGLAKARNAKKKKAKKAK